MSIILQETMRAVFYAPFYAAMELQFYTQEGVDVRFESSSHGSNVALKLLDGSIDVVWGGPMRVMLTNEKTAESDLICFCEVVTRDPFFVVGRESRPDFRLHDLVGKRFGVVSEVPTPWMCLQDDFRRAGIDPSDLQFSPSRTMAENVQALRDGDVDAIQVFEPFVEELLEDGAGHIWYASAARGLTSYTTLYTRQSTFNERREELSKMVRAIFRTQKWFHATSAAEIAEVVSLYFPDLPRSRLTSALNRYKALEIWNQDPRLPKGGYERLRAGLVSGGLVREGASFESAVDNSLADEAIGVQPAPLHAS